MPDECGIIWDFDGTLAERPGLWAGSLLEVLAAEDPHLQLSCADIAMHMHTGFPWHTPDRAHPHLCDPDAWWQEMIDLLSGILERLGYASDRARTHAACVRRHYLDGNIGWRVFPDTAVALQRLKDHGCRQVILSNHVPELAALVHQLGLAGYFDAIITSALTGFEKPHDVAYKIAREALPKGANLWMVGDNEEADALGPERNGIQSVLLRRTAAPPARRARRQAADLISAVDLILSASER